MATPKAILNALKAQLQADTTLAGYIKQTMIDPRESVTIYPSIFVVWLGDDESPDTTGYQRITMKVAIVCDFKAEDKDRQVVGDVNQRGALDIKNDIVKAIDVDRTIGGNAIYAYIRGSERDWKEYPITRVVVNLDILFTQVVGVRT